MRRLIRFIGTIGAGAALAYLFDPDRGRSRRTRLADQAAARMRDATDTVEAKVRYQKNVVSGFAHEVADMTREDEPIDDSTLRQKIRSEALGPFGRGHDLEVDVTDGNVLVRGSIDNEEDRAELLRLVESVDGVLTVEDRTSVS